MTAPGDEQPVDENIEEEAIRHAFGEASRRAALQTYFAGIGSLAPREAWKHVYRLLLWIDRTTGLAHCYESDKSQPGRPWYSRSLAFHAWLATELGSTPADLQGEIDALFKAATERLARVVARELERRSTLAAQQLRQYEGQGFPTPGADPELEAIIQTQLHSSLHQTLSTTALRTLIEHVRAHLTVENRRKNLVGEGFEDVLAAIISRAAASLTISVQTRPLLQDIQGFRPPRGNEKPRRVDLVILGPGRQRRLVSAKWSIRSDREGQLRDEWQAYNAQEAAGEDWDYVLITNEFDPARLKRACDIREYGRPMFSSIVHVNPSGPLAAYGSVLRGAARDVPERMRGGRLVSLEHWLSELLNNS